MKQIWTFLVKIFNEFFADDCLSMAAAVAYYTVFALPPLLALIIMLVSLVWNPEEAKGVVQGQMAEVVGQRGAEQVQTMMQNAVEHRSGPAAILGFVALLAAATGAFVQLQAALNRAWGVAPDPNQSTIKNFFFKRLLSFAIILVIVVLLLAFMLLSTVLASFGDYIARLLPEQLSQTVLWVLNVTLSFLVVALLFAAIFKWLPDAKIVWKDTLVGALVTAVLFVLGQLVIGYYLTKTSAVSAYGAAGSLALILLWIYYSSLILLLGAEFTQTWTQRYGAEVEPAPGAVRVERKLR